ncbi:MAG: glycosyltransferase [Acidimicrobiales bacterium]
MGRSSQTTLVVLGDHLRNGTRATLSLRQLEMLRSLRRQAVNARARIAVVSPGLARFDHSPNALSRARGLFLLAQQQRDEARAQLRAARQQRDALSAERATLRRQLAEAQAHRDPDRQRKLLREQVRSARAQRDAAGADRALLRDQLRATRAERDGLRREMDVAANGEFTTAEQFERLRGRPLSGTSNGFGELRDLRYGPVGTQNPVLSLLYSRCPEHGLLPRPIRKIDPLKPVPLKPGSILNLQWTRFVQLGCETPSEAAAKSEELLVWLRNLKDREIHLVWTIHEELPHDCQFPEIEIELRSELARLASLVHVLHPSTVEQVKPYYELDPAKVLVVEHPLYTGLYPDYATRETSRRMLDLDDDEFTVLLFGTIRPYKGIDRLLSAVSKVRRKHPDRRVRLIIAGPTFKSVDNAQVILRAKATPGVTIEPHSIHALHVQYLFRACDLVALPYNEFLNSGVLLLALTFERPVLAANEPVTEDMASSGLVRCFERTSDESLFCELERAVTEPQLLPTGPLEPDFVRKHDPLLLAEQLARGFRTILDPVPASGP